MNHAELVEYLESVHPPPQWAFLTGVRSMAGWPAYPKKERYIDAFAMNLWPSTGHLRVAYEVKVSRGDWLRELRSPEKHAAAISLSHRFYFVLADGVWKPEDQAKVLTEAGVTVVGHALNGKWSRDVVRAPTRQVKPMPEGFIAMLLRAARRASRNA